MKKIYFIRHGESDGNAHFELQGGDGALTERGRKQSRSVAERLAHVPFTALVSSPFPRAQETAEIIAVRVEKEIEYSELFTERRNASAQIGVSRNAPASIEIEREIMAHFGEPGWHYDDEENFEDMTARGGAALAYLIARPENEIAVVTHGYFMRVMLARALAGESLTPELCLYFLTSFRTANTGISVMVNDEDTTRPWWLWTWNDHAHLSG